VARAQGGEKWISSLPDPLLPAVIECFQQLDNVLSTQLDHFPFFLFSTLGNDNTTTFT
jgi:hypothetical protein